eukprot:3188865-Rhodomonas_salina.2
MPAHSTIAVPTAKSLVNDRAAALRNAGIRRSCRRSIPDAVIEPANQPAPAPTPAQEPAAPAAHDHMDCCQEPASQAGSEEPLPKGCIMGIPLPKGTGVTRVPHMPITIDLAIMRSIQADNYKFIRHMIMTGWTPTNPSAC